MQGITTNHIKDTPTMQSVPDQPPKQVPPKHTHYNPPGKIALRPSSIPTTEALNRIASAVNKSRRGFDETDALMRSGSGSECDEKRQMNGKYLEIPHLLDGFRMVRLYLIIKLLKFEFLIW